MPEQFSKEAIHNLVQHVLWRAGTTEHPTAERLPLANRDQLIHQLDTAACEQAAQQFAFSPEASEWLVSANRLIYSVLEQVRLEPDSEEKQEALMHAINCLDAFGQVQKLIRKEL